MRRRSWTPALEPPPANADAIAIVVGPWVWVVRISVAAGGRSVIDIVGEVVGDSIDRKTIDHDPGGIALHLNSGPSRLHNHRGVSRNGRKRDRICLRSQQTRYVEHVIAGSTLRYSLRDRIRNVIVGALAACKQRLVVVDEIHVVRPVGTRVDADGVRDVGPPLGQGL